MDSLNMHSFSWCKSRTYLCLSANYAAHVSQYSAENGNLRKSGSTFRHGTVFAPKECLHQKEARGMESPKMSTETSNFDPTSWDHPLVPPTTAVWQIVACKQHSPRHSLSLESVPPSMNIIELVTVQALASLSTISRMWLLRPKTRLPPYLFPFPLGSPPTSVSLSVAV